MNTERRKEFVSKLRALCVDNNAVTRCSIAYVFKQNKRWDVNYRGFISHPRITLNSIFSLNGNDNIKVSVHKKKFRKELKDLCLKSNVMLECDFEIVYQRKGKKQTSQLQFRSHACSICSLGMSLLKPKKKSPPKVPHLTTLNLEKRLERLEEGLTVPGTSLSRVLDPDQPGLRWCLGIGNTGMPKQFFYGNTIDKVLALAESNLKTTKHSKRNGFKSFG